MKNRKIFILFLSVSIVQANIRGQNGDVPLNTVFYQFGENILNSITYNCGFNFITSVVGTYGLIDNGLDWQWNRIAYNNIALARAGFPSLYIGYLVPALMPITFYTIGRLYKNEKLQITGLAIAQSLFISLGIDAVLKGITGRESPGIVDVLDHSRSFQTEDYSDKFDWGFFRRGILSGWPSAHTTTAFAAAVTIAEIYDDNILLKIGIYSYAALIGLGVSLNVHWASEVFSGALIGYAVGKTVGSSFNQLLKDDQKKDPFSFFITSNFVGFILRI
ncbi:hypothetical protein FACS1894172_11440 [Spirochaetia bacterium]|nr:hypothetical protein FACS1894172_11440 [Spirochaetia bacterium]